MKYKRSEHLNEMCLIVDEYNLNTRPSKFIFVFYNCSFKTLSYTFQFEFDCLQCLNVLHWHLISHFVNIHVFGYNKQW